MDYIEIIRNHTDNETRKIARAKRHQEWFTKSSRCTCIMMDSFYHSDSKCHYCSQETILSFLGVDRV